MAGPFFLEKRNAYVYLLRFLGRTLRPGFCARDGRAMMRVIFAVVLMLLAVDVSAQGSSSCSDYSDNCTQSQAQQLASLDCQEINATNGPGQPMHGWSCYEIGSSVDGDGKTGWFAAYVNTTEAGGCGGSCGVTSRYPARYWRSPDDDCSSRSPIANKWSTNFTFCDDGCQYAAADDVSVCVGTPGEAGAFCGSASWTPTGQTCSNNDAPKDYDPESPVCSSIGMGWVECTKPDGSVCANHTSGTKLCWGKSDTGKRSTSDGKYGGDRNNDPSDNSPPDNMENPESNGGQKTTHNGYTTNTNYYTGTGGSAGQPNTGVGGRDPSQGNTGGSGGDGNEDGEGNCDPQSEDCTGAGTASGQVGEYGASRAQSIGARYEQFKAAAMASPLVSATSGFFQVSVSGSCPTFDAVSNDYFGTITFNFCEPWIQDFLSWGGIVFLMIACYAALKVAIG